MVRRASILAAALVCCAFVWVVRSPVEFAPNDPRSKEFWSVDGKMLEVRPNATGERCMWRDLSSLSPELAEAFIASEDHRFRQHSGIDWFAIARLLHPSQGGAGVSTITLQTARLLRAPSKARRSFATKLSEVRLAFALERAKSKDEILAEYLNRVPLGRGTIGVEAASWAYFGHGAHEVTASEARFLAALAPAPSARGRTRQTSCRAYARRSDTECPSTIDFVWPALASHANALGIATIDSRIQIPAETALARSRQRMLVDGVADGSVVVVDLRDGAVVALVGSRPGSTAAFVNGATAWRQAGSVLKPFLYMQYFEDGHSSEEYLPDLPRCFRERDALFCPENNSRTFLGATTPREALASSLNVPAVTVLERVGVERYLERLIALKLVRADERANRLGLGLALGDVETNLLGLTFAFSRLATSQHPAALSVMSVLSDVNGRRAGFGVHANSIPTGIAYKTGTSAWGRDLWAVGSDGVRAVGVWLGNSDGAATSAFAIDSAAQVMADTFSEIHRMEGDQ